MDCKMQGSDLMAEDNWNCTIITRWKRRKIPDISPAFKTVEKNKSYSKVSLIFWYRNVFCDFSQQVYFPN